jgi:recombination protein RecA
MYGNPETTTGGNALKFYASVRIDIRKSETLKTGAEAYGNHVKAKVVKNKVAPPFKTAEFDILYGSGISKSGEIVDLAIELGLVEKSGSFFTYKETKIQGKDKMKAYLESNSEIMAELEVRIKEKIINGEVEADEELDFDTSSFDLDSLNLD